MDEEDTKAALDWKLGPGRLISRSARMRSPAWICSSCQQLVTSKEPIPVPAPCKKCGGVAFETVERPLQ